MSDPKQSDKPEHATLREARDYVAATHQHLITYTGGVKHQEPCARCELRDKIDAILAAPVPDSGDRTLLPGLKEAQKIIGNGSPRADWFAIEDRITTIDPAAGTYPAVPAAPAEGPTLYARLMAAASSGDHPMSTNILMREAAAALPLSASGSNAELVDRIYAACKNWPDLNTAAWTLLRECAAVISKAGAVSTSGLPAKDEARLLWLETTIKHCPHAELSYNDDPDEGPVGFYLLIESCSRLDLRAPTLDALIDIGMTAAPDEDGNVIACAPSASGESKP